MNRLAYALTSLLLVGCAEQPVVGGLRICLTQNDLPRAESAGPSGLDVEIAELLAVAMNRELDIVWLEKPNLNEIESTDIDFLPILKGRCEVYLSVPGAEAIRPFEDRIALSQSYYGTAFEMIPPNAGVDLEAWRGGKLAVRANSVAHIVVDRLGVDWTMKRNNEEIVAAVASGEAVAGLVWGPDLALLHQDYDATFEPPTVLRWNQHAVTRADDTELLREIDQVFSDPREQARIHRLLTKFRIPDHGAFETAHRLADLRTL